MSGSPTEAEIRAQWQKAIDVLETVRNFADGTMANAGGKLDLLLQSLEGDYTPFELAQFANGVRSGLSALVTPGVASSAITPILFEYGKILSAHATLGFGGGYRTPAELFRALYEWFIANSITVQSRNITYAGAVAGGSNVGNGVMSRLTVDENNKAIEACTVEKKAFRCRADQSSGTDKWAEVFEVLGTAASYDALMRASFGSGESGRTTIISHHAGTGAGGSLLTNSTFSDYSATASPKFSAWTEVSGSAGISQDATNYYRSHPGSSLDASLKLSAGSGTMLLKQSLSNSRVRRLDPNTPYFLRVMLNKTIGTAVGGTVTIRLGSQSTSVTIAGMSANWTELLIPVGQGNWFRRFDQDSLSLQIEWNTPTSGYLLVDDVLFAPYDLVDGTWWFMRQNAATPTAWLVDDVLTFTDTGGAPATGKIQWWLYVAGYGYLPSTTGVPTITDP